MKTKDILNLDCRSEKNQEIIQLILRQIKPLSKCTEENIPLNKIEKCIKTLCKKYNMLLAPLTSDIFASDQGIIWECKIIDQNNFSNLGTCYGLSVYEVLCKVTILLYSLSKKRRRNDN